MTNSWSWWQICFIEKIEISSTFNHLYYSCDRTDGIKRWVTNCSSLFRMWWEINFGGTSHVHDHRDIVAMQLQLVFDGLNEEFLKWWKKPTNSPKCSLYPRINEVEMGYSDFAFTVCSSVYGQNRVHFASSTILIGSILYLHILSNNFRWVVSKVFFFFFKIH